MNKVVLSGTIRFLLLTLVQVLFLKNIGYYNISIPFMYILFILLLPFNIPNFLLFFLAFISGLIVDMFYDTPGLHAASCSVLAFVRIIFINNTVQKQSLEYESEPRLSIMGFRWFFFYTTILTLSHHFTFFALETYNLSDLTHTFIRTLLSSLLTLFLILIAEFVSYKRRI